MNIFLLYSQNMLIGYMNQHHMLLNSYLHHDSKHLNNNFVCYNYFHLKMCLLMNIFDYYNLNKLIDFEFLHHMF